MKITPRSTYLALILSTTTVTVSAHNIYLPLVPLQTRHTASSPQERTVIQTYSTMHYRTAHEAFMKHGTDTKPLSSLYFNSDEFRLSHAFQNCLVPTNSKNYNPYMRVIKMRPRVTYAEHGATIGGRIEATIGKKRSARIGIRAQLPFKRREVERKDAGSRGPAETQDVVIQSQKIGVPRTDNPTSPAAKEGHAYRLDFIEALPKDNAYNGGIDHDATGGNTRVFARSVVNNEASPKRIAGAFVYKPESYPPRGSETFTHSLAKGETGGGGGTSGITDYLPATLTGLSEGSMYEMEKGNKYAAIADDATDKTVAERIADQDAKATVWLIPTFSDESGGIYGDADLIRQNIEKTINMYNENPHEWFHDRGYRLESDHCIGLGDLTVEGYLDFDLTNCLTIHLCGGVVAPTASGRTGANNPYLIHLGNRGHKEFFAGGGFDCTLNKKGTFSLSADAKYSKVQKATEKIAATAVGAQIKNMGPEVEADIEWKEVNGNAWLHFTHPQTRTVTCSVGYSFHCKAKDRVTFLDDSAESWLGKTYNTTSKTFADAHNLTLDTTAAQANTQSIAHTVRSRFSYDISRWVNINAGGAYTIAGKNTPQTMELSAGCIVKF